MAVKKNGLAEELVQTKKKKTLSKGLIIRNLVVDLSESEIIDSEQEKLPLTQVVTSLVFENKMKTKKIRLIKQFNKPLRPALIPIVPISIVLHDVVISEQNIGSTESGLPHIDLKDKWKGLLV